MAYEDDHIDPYYYDRMRQIVKMIGPAKARRCIDDVVKAEKIVEAPQRRHPQRAADGTRKERR